MKKLFLFAFFLFFFFSLAFDVQSVGIGGVVKETIFFEPNLEKSYVYDVISNTDKIMDHRISIGGDLAPYFNLSTEVLKLAPGETASFTATMKLPATLEPGKHEAFICAEESKARGGEAEGTSIGTKVRVCAIITVFSPKSGKHAQFEFKVENVSKGENATFQLDVTNTSSEEIDVHGVIEVGKKAEAEKLATLETQREHLKKCEKALLSATLNTSKFEIGEYSAKATLFFDGSQETKEKSFRIGTLYIAILDWTKEVMQNKLNPIAVKVQSKWNSEIKGVYASFEIASQKMAEKTTIYSPPTNLKAWETKEIVAYWDTKGVEAGDYDLKIALHYEDKTTEQEGTITVKLEKKLLLFTAFLVIAVAIIIAVLVVLLIKLKKAQQKLRQTRLKIKKK